MSARSLRAAIGVYATELWEWMSAAAADGSRRPTPAVVAYRSPADASAKRQGEFYVHTVLGR